MVDISGDTNVIQRRAEVTSVVRRRHWSNEEKGEIGSEAIAPGAVVPDVARRRVLVPQQLSNWIRAAKDGGFALPADAMPSFVPVVLELAHANEAAHERRPVGIEIVIGTIKVRVPGGANTRDIEAVLRRSQERQVPATSVLPGPDPGAVVMGGSPLPRHRCAKVGR